MSKMSFLFLLVVCMVDCKMPAPSSTVSQTTSPSPTPTVEIPTVPDDVLIPWKETLGGTYYRWNGKDLFVRRPQTREVGVFSQAANKYRASFQRENGKCDLDSFFTPTAVVGDLISYEHESGFFCGTASGEWRYATIDISNSTRFLDLRNFFNEDQLLRAFMANSQLASDVQKSIEEKKLVAIPTTLKQLSAFLTKYDYQIFNGAFYFEPDYLTRFAFHHLDGDMVCIRVSATSTSTAGRANHEFAEIYLPMPDKLREKLQTADSGEKGFLMKDSETKVGTKPAMFESKF